MKKTILFALAVIFTITIYSQQKCFRIGIHADRDFMFTNIFRCASLNTTGVPMDTNGYPLVVPYQGISNVDYYLDALEEHYDQDSTYVLRWDGDGNFKWFTWFNDNQVTESLHDTVNRQIIFTVKYVADPRADGYIDQHRYTCK